MRRVFDFIWRLISGRKRNRIELVRELNRAGDIAEVFYYVTVNGKIVRGSTEKSLAYALETYNRIVRSNGNVIERTVIESIEL